MAAQAADKMSPKDMPPKTVAVLGAVCLTTGWLLASMLTPPVAKLQSLPERRTASAAAAASDPPAAFTEQLHLKLQQAPAAAGAAPQPVHVRQQTGARATGCGPARAR